MKKLVLLSLVFGLTACGDLPVPTEGLMTPPSVEKALKDTLDKAKGTTGDMMEGGMDAMKDTMDNGMDGMKDMMEGANNMVDGAANAAMEIKGDVIDTMTGDVPEPILPEDEEVTK